MPPRVVDATALHTRAGGACSQALEPRKRFLELVAPADDADELLHRVLQLGMDGVRVFVTASLERRREALRIRALLCFVRARRRSARAVFRRGLTRALAEDEQIRERVPAEPVRTVHAGRHLARGIQARHRRGGSVRVDADASHDVVKRRTDLHRLLCNVDVGELLELVVHRRQPAADVVGGPARRDVEEHTAVLGPASRLHFCIDRARDLVAREQVGRAPVVLLVRVPAVGFGLVVGRLALEELRDVIEHEALALGVLQRPAVAAHALGDEDAAHRRRPDHPGRVELDELHVDQVGARPEREGLAVAGVFPRVRRDLPRLADTARGEHDGLGLEEDELAGVAPVAEGAADAVALLQEPLDLALHVDVDALVDAVVLERPDHLEAGPVADVGQARIAMAAEVALEDASVLGAIEQGAPALQLEHALGRFLGVQLRHPPVVQHLAAAHRVAEMDLPVVLGPDVAERGGDPALGHDRVRLAQE